MEKTFDIENYIREMKAILGDRDLPELWEAVRYADKLHRGQKRMSGAPYIIHPCSVARILAEEFGLREPSILIAAVLHDIVEDVGGITTDILRDKFGNEVAEIVEGCTKIKAASGGPKLLRTLIHQKLFTHAANKGAVLLVKLADRLHNIRTLRYLPARKRQKIADETLTIYAPLAKIMGMYVLKRELYSGALKFRFPKKSQKILRHIERIENSQEVKQTKQRLEKVFAYQGLDAEVRLRAKNLGGYYDPANQSLLLENNPDNPIDFIVLAKTVPDCYRALGIINQTFPPNPRSLRDFIARPKANGYQSLHVRADVGGTFYLFKIRTRDMHWLARHGVIADLMGGGKTGKEFYGDIAELLEFFGEDTDVDYKGAIEASEKDVLFTYTPKGDVIQMPAGSVVLDFAYRVHSQLGDACYGAIVDGKRVDCDAPLTDGARVKILRSPNRIKEVAVTDENICKTPKARMGTRRKINRKRRLFAEKVGRSILRQVLERQKLGEEILDDPAVESIMRLFKAHDKNELWRKIGTDEIKAWDVAGKILKESGRRKLIEGRNTLRIDSLDSLCIKLAHCCNPYPGEENVIGLLSERGLSIHRRGCSELERYHVETRDMEVIDWNHELDISGTEWTVTLRDETPVKILDVLAGASKTTDDIIEIYSIRYVEEGRGYGARHLKEESPMGSWLVVFRAPDILALKDYIEFIRANIEHVVFERHEGVKRT